jgi:hypothetical protein
MIVPAALLSVLLVSARAQVASAPARRGGAVVERYFASDWAKADASAAPVPAAPNLAAPGPDDPVHEKHSQPAHMSITRAAYAYYASRYEGGELAQYIGESDGRVPVSDTNDNVVAGSYDEDSPNNNPWDQTFPELNHFWDCRRGPFAGLWGNDSSVNRAQKYFTGGYGLTDAYDFGWNVHGIQGHGLLWYYRNGDTALAYWYLGHAAHLLEDATVPAHVLLYPHPFADDDAYETYMGTHFGDWENKLPSGEVDSFDTLYDLFYHTADVTNDFDAGSGPGSRGRDGKKDQGARRGGGFTEESLRAEGDVLMPLAYRRVAALFLYFFKQIDHAPPRVTLLFPRSSDEGAPSLTADSRPTLSARAVDDVSGVDRRGYRFEYALWTGTAWSAWRAASAQSTSSSLDFPVEAGRRYAVRVSAVDAAGNRSFSATGYLTSVSAPAVASAR